MNDVIISLLAVFGERQLEYFITRRHTYLKEGNEKAADDIKQMLKLEGFELKEDKDKVQVFLIEEAAKILNNYKPSDLKEIVLEIKLEGEDNGDSK